MFEPILKLLASYPKDLSDPQFKAEFMGEAATLRRWFEGTGKQVRKVQSLNAELIDLINQELNNH